MIVKANVTENNIFVSGVFTRCKKYGSKGLHRSWVYMAFIAILNTCSQKPPNCFDILCRGILEICTYVKQIRTNHANIYKNFKNTIFHP